MLNPQNIAAKVLLGLVVGENGFFNGGTQAWMVFLLSFLHQSNKVPSKNHPDVANPASRQTNREAYIEPSFATWGFPQIGVPVVFPSNKVLFSCFLQKTPNRVPWQMGVCQSREVPSNVKPRMASPLRQGAKRLSRDFLCRGATPKFQSTDFMISSLALRPWMTSFTSERLGLPVSQQRIGTRNMIGRRQLLVNGSSLLNGRGRMG